MIKEETIGKLVDYILLNACSVNSSGLYNGKAGMTLALFETSRYLNDKYIEEQAFVLLQESLLIKTDDISFENGLSGIGYVLLYLIKNNFIDADFDELFGEQYEKIIVGIDKFKKSPNVILNSLHINNFLSLVKLFKPHDDNINQSMKSIFEANELYLAIHFSDFSDIDYVGNKSKVLKRFESYLKTVCECDYSDYSNVVIDRYADIYRKGRISSSYIIANYLKIIDAEEGNYEDVIEGDKKFNSLYYTFLSLKDIIEFSNLNDNNEFIESRLLKADMSIEENILSLLPQNALVAGYDQGISRLLIYLSKTQAI